MIVTAHNSVSAVARLFIIPDMRRAAIDVPPVEFEAAHYRRLKTNEPVGIQ